MSEMFRGVRPVVAPPELRERVLAAAREAAAEPAVGRRSGWGFGRFDLALAATLLLLLLGHVVVGGRQSTSIPSSSSGRSAEATGLLSEVGPVVVAVMERDRSGVGAVQTQHLERLLVEVERL